MKMSIKTSAKKKNILLTKKSTKYKICLQILYGAKYLKHYKYVSYVCRIIVQEA